MSRRRKSRKGIIWLVVLVVVIVVVVAVVMMRGRNGKANGSRQTVKAETGNIVEKALAVGSIVPRNEISVKSKVSGVVRTVFK